MTMAPLGEQVLELEQGVVVGVVRRRMLAMTMAAAAAMGGEAGAVTCEACGEEGQEEEGGDVRNNHQITTPCIFVQTQTQCALVPIT